MMEKKGGGIVEHLGLYVHIPFCARKCAYCLLKKFLMLCQILLFIISVLEKYNI